ncbi:MFS transporter [Paraneptunicella aestuarii]|uniref:MFS transporter n=1 Tax=Paraneptunicella aestuarii TaxID=2831148 RepID=UPI001E2879ED|nr:MFS transporter [Paraneptunicella aestuarii]UAA39058.1 MFS transporter [Paraneptunicella aestuarii]
MNQTELRGAFSLAAIYLMRMLGLFMIMPVIALLAPAYPDYSPMLVGLAIGGYGLTQALMQIPMGMLSDRFGRKPIIAFGLVMFVAGSVIAAMADSLWMVVFGRVLQGAGAIAGAVMALAADISRENQRAKVMAIIGIAIGFSFYLAVIIGPVIASSMGLSGIFSVTAVLAVLCFPLLFFGVPSIDQAAPRGDTLPSLEGIRQLVSEPSLWRLNISVLLLHCLITLIFVQLPVLFLNQGWQLAEHWTLYLPILIASIFGMALLMGLQRKLLGGHIMRLSILMLAMACSGLAWHGEKALFLFFFVWVFFSAFNYLEANFPALVSSIAPAGQKGSAMGIYASFQFFGAFLGGVLSGYLSGHFDIHTVFVTATGMCVLWLFMFVGFQGAQHLKRYTLAYNLPGVSTEELRELFGNIDGIIDFTIVPQESAVYLKVDSQVFDLQQARKIANPESAS